MIPNKEVLEKIILHLQEVMRIQDWDIKIEICGDRKIEEKSGDYHYACCENNMKLHRAIIYINKDHEGIEEWYPTLVHEMYHIVTQNHQYHTKSMLDYVQDEVIRDKEKNMLIIYYEQMVEDLAKGFVNAYPLITVLDKLKITLEEVI